MRNKRFIWLLVILVFGLFGGGFYYAASRQTSPWPIEVKKLSLTRHFLFFLHHDQIIDGMISAAKEAHEDPSNWKKVVVEYSGSGDEWFCEVYEESPRGLELTATIHVLSDWSGQMWFNVNNPHPLYNPATP
jgi:hypothetical protein